MTATSLIAKANEGAGTDQLAGFSTATGFAGAVVLLSDAGAPWSSANPVPVALMAPATLPVSVTDLPLPAGAATASAQAALLTAVNLLLRPNEPVQVSNFPATQAVSAAALPLPAGAATQTTLASIDAEIQLIESYFKAEDVTAVSGDKGLPLLAMRQLADTTSTDTDGDYTLIKIDEEGRVKVATKPASFDLLQGNITANGQTTFADVRRASNVMITAVATSLVGHNASFEGSIDSTNGTDGNWFGIQVVRSNANVIETATGTLSVTPVYAWEASVNGLSFIRARATAHTSGTVTYKFQRGSYATEPIPAAQASGTQPVSGTVTATVGTSITGGTISPLTVAGASIEASSAKTVSGNSAAAITNASGRGGVFFVNVTAVAGTAPTLAVRLQVQDPVSLNWVDIPGAVTASITANGTYMLCVCPGLAETANARVNYALPRTYRLAWTIAGTTPSFTFSVGMQPVI